MKEVRDAFASEQIQTRVHELQSWTQIELTYYADSLIDPESEEAMNDSVATLIALGQSLEVEMDIEGIEALLSVMDGLTLNMGEREWSASDIMNINQLRALRRLARTVLRLPLEFRRSQIRLIVDALNGQNWRFRWPQGD